MQSLFKPGSKINQDHKHKYIHILAYAASVVETWKKVENERTESGDRRRRLLPEQPESPRLTFFCLFDPPRINASTSTKTS